MSPEQILGEEIDGRSDIFSFGVVLYELVTGRLPYRGEHEAALFYSIVHEGPVAVSSLRTKVPPSLVDLISKCLAKEKEGRYPGCEQLVVELKKVAQEITGYVDSEVRERPKTKLPTWIILSAFLAIVVTGLVLYILFAPTGKSRSARPSIAILYVENLTGDAHYDSFSIGLTEEITNEISNIPGLEVISRNEVAQYRGKPVDMHEIGKTLGVSYVLEGSMRVEGKRLRVTCQAIQTSDRFHFWSQGFTRELTDVLEVQTDVAQQIALGLKTKFAQKNTEEKLGLPQNSLLKQ